MLTLGARPFLAPPPRTRRASPQKRAFGTTRLREPNTPARTAGREPEWANAGSPVSQAHGVRARRLRAQKTLIHWVGFDPVNQVLTPSHSSVGRVKLSQPVSVRRQPLSQTPSKLRPPCVTRPWPSGPEVLQPPS